MAFPSTFFNRLKTYWNAPKRHLVRIRLKSGNNEIIQDVEVISKSKRRARLKALEVVGEGLSISVMGSKSLERAVKFHQ
jgi:hypothetical protein